MKRWHDLTVEERAETIELLKDAIAREALSPSAYNRCMAAVEELESPTWAPEESAKDGVQW